MLDNRRNSNFGIFPLAIKEEEKCKPWENYEKTEPGRKVVWTKENILLVQNLIFSQFASDMYILRIENYHFTIVQIVTKFLFQFAKDDAKRNPLFEFKTSR